MAKLPKSEIQRLKRANKLLGSYILGVDPASSKHTARRSRSELDFLFFII